MIIKFGQGKVGVMCYGSKEDDVDYGVALTLHDEEHAINESDPSVIDKRVEDVTPALQLEFSKSVSVQVLIDNLTRVRDSLVVWEHRRALAEPESKP